MGEQVNLGGVPEGQNMDPFGGMDVIGAPVQQQYNDMARMGGGKFGL